MCCHGCFYCSCLFTLFMLTVSPPAPWFCFSGVPVSSRVSAKIQQLVNTLKRPKRPPLREFFVDDFEELLEGERARSYPLVQCFCDPIEYSVFLPRLLDFLRTVILVFLGRQGSCLETVGTILQGPFKDTPVPAQLG